MISAMPKSPKGGTVWSQSFHPQKLAKTGERQLLPVFTLARFVCSWR